MDRLRGEPSYRPCMMLKDIHRDYEVELNYNKVWKGKELAMHDIHGVEEGAYDRLRWYCSAIKETNPGSFVECEIDHYSNNFKLLFICFNACATGFINGGRPLVFLDDTHIKNKYKGCILVVVAKDANDDLFTLAYLVVDVENDDNWGWFCFQLKSALLSYPTMEMVKRLSPSKENALAKTYAESRSLKLRKACGWSFEVVDGDKSFAVDLSAMTCSCRA
ncbi:hypothetical protein ZIOFF_018631 [Zingiber officinale]|uniref:MULE transposase domain-containing protein n=1 Tax=Zingiber officinale TaxID=94328 RepID=A0A8J5H6B0_ZINOF|nr:hypothetical protein ZIOFF_018631 [Zingiber officinale]